MPLARVKQNPVLCIHLYASFHLRPVFLPASALGKLSGPAYAAPVRMVRAAARQLRPAG